MAIPLLSEIGNSTDFGHSWPCFDQDVGLDDFQLNYPMTI